MTAAVIKAEKIHNILGWQGEGVDVVPGPEGGVPGHGVPAVLLDPVQVQHGVPGVPRVLKNMR